MPIIEGEKPTPDEKENRELRTAECLGAAIKAIVASGGRVVYYEVDNHKDEVKIRFTLRPRYKPHLHEKKGRSVKTGKTSKYESPLSGIRKGLEDQLCINELSDILANMAKKRKELGLEDPTLDIFKELVSQLSNDKTPNNQEILLAIKELVSQNRTNETQELMKNNQEFQAQQNKILVEALMTLRDNKNDPKQDLLDTARIIKDLQDKKEKDDTPPKPKNDTKITKHDLDDL